MANSFSFQHSQLQRKKAKTLLEHLSGNRGGFELWQLLSYVLIEGALHQKGDRELYLLSDICYSDGLCC